MRRSYSFFVPFILFFYTASLAPVMPVYGYDVAKSIWAIVCATSAVITNKMARHRLAQAGERERALCVALSLAMRKEHSDENDMVTGLPASLLHTKDSIVLPNECMRLSYQYEGLSLDVLRSELLSAQRAKKWSYCYKIISYAFALCFGCFACLAYKEAIIQEDYSRFFEGERCMIISGPDAQREAARLRNRVNNALEFVYMHANQSEFKQLLWPFKRELDAVTRLQLDREWGGTNNRIGFLSQRIKTLIDEEEPTHKTDELDRSFTFCESDSDDDNPLVLD